jgi:FkbH-like protein
VALARELSAGVAQLFGRQHRALLTDWDNTIWGGEVGEVGPLGVVCGHESPDGLGYLTLQTYLRDLNAAGVLLGGVSRNAPEAAEVLEQNPDLVLRREHFVSLALSWGNKSDSISAIQSQLGFGVEFMLYVDDSLVDLAEALTTHRDIDVVSAGPNPDQTLDRLSTARFFCALHVTDDDVQRPRRTAALLEQRTSSPDAAGFLRSLQMRLSVSGMTDVNKPRLLQLIQKTNQFNLTTRRHGERDIADLQSRGATIAAFSYADRFGSQGIVGLAILVPEGPDTLIIDTWLMSCRVLNRGVEEAMFEWIVRLASRRTLVGQYVPTEKNGLVRDLYHRLGFSIVDQRQPLTYQLTGEAGVQWTPEHHLECADA